MITFCGREGVLLAAAMSSALLSAPAFAAGTPAGTTIDNVASATFDGPGGPSTVQSNTVTLRVDELLDVVVTSTDPADVPARNGETDRALSFRITNSGNGPEAFNLTALGTLGGDDFDPTVTSIVLDDGDNVYEPGIDPIYVASSNNPVLGPDQNRTIFIVSTMPTSAANGARGQARLTATAVTGSGNPGTVFVGQGQGGGDAVVGTSRATQADEGFYILSSVLVALVKSATVLDPFGGARSLPGSIITYTLRADLTGGGTAPNLAVSDAVPTGTTYQAGTITLNGAALTDAVDADAGRFSISAISVALGSPAAGTSHTITFKVRID